MVEPDGPSGPPGPLPGGASGGIAGPQPTGSSHAPVGPTAGAPPGAAGTAAADRPALSTLPWDLTDPQDDRTLPPWFRRAVVLVLVLAAAARVVVWGFDQLESLWYILFLAFFIGLTLEPPVNRMAALGLRRGLGTILVMLGLGLATAAFFAVFGNLLVQQLAQLISSIPDLLSTAVERTNARLGTDLSTDSILASLGIGTTEIAKAAADLGVGLLSIVAAAVGLVFNLFTVALFAFYFAADGPRFRAVVASWLPPAHQRTVLTVWDIATQKAGGYVLSRGILAIVSAAYHAVVFLVLDLPYWLPLAMWVGLVSQFVPTIGTYLAGALPIAIALVEGDWVKALVILVAVIVYQQVENYFIAPRVTRSTLEIHPAVAFGSVIVGGTLFGAMGALLAIPVVATIQAVISVYGRRYELVQDFGTGEGPAEQRVRTTLRAADTAFRTEPHHRR